MNKLKRVPVKYIRDILKNKYEKNNHCYICKSTKELEFHHLYSVSELFNIWCLKNNIKEITSVEEINKHRRNFEKSFSHELSNENAFTLCKRHHERLHNIFGQRYTKDLTPKVKNWINIQREKMENEL